MTRPVAPVVAALGAIALFAPVAGARDAPDPSLAIDVCGAGTLGEELSCIRGMPSFVVPGAAPAETGALATLDPDCPLPGWDDRCEAWTALYDNPNGATGFGPDQVTAISAGDRRTYVTGGSWDDTTQHYDVLTAAYDQETGVTSWTARYDGPEQLFDAGFAIAVDSREELVYVAGTRDGPDAFGGDAVVVALDASTGTLVWEASFAGTAMDHDIAYSVTVAGTTVYAAGTAHGSETGEDGFVLALDAATGDREWIATGFDGGHDAVYAVRVGEGRVVASGIAEGPGGAMDHLVVAFRTGGAAPGQMAWEGRFDGGGHDDAYALAISPDGATAVVAGASQRGSGTAPFDYLTVAYDVSSGERRWVARYGAPDSAARPGQAVANAVAISPDGTRVFVTGTATGAEPNVGSGFTTVAYDIASGQRAWASLFHPPATTYGVGTSIVVSPNGRRVYSTGNSFAGYFVMKGAYTTVAHDAGTGQQVWVGRYQREMDDVADLLPYASYVAAGRDGKRVFVTGTFLNFFVGDGTQTFSDYWTFGYTA